MASIGAEDYRIGKNLVEKFESEAEEYLNANRAVIFKDDIQRRAAEGNRILGRLDVLVEGLEDHSKKRNKWEKKRNDIQELVKRIENEWK